MVDLKDLKKIDLAKIDASKLMATVMANKDMLGQAVVILISLFILIGQLGSYFSQMGAYEARKSQLNGNTDPIQAFNDIQERLKTFQDGLDKALGEDEFSSVIADFAAQTKVDILSFSPEIVDENQLYSVVAGRMLVRAEKFEDFLRFLQAMEGAPLAIRVDMCALGKAGGAGFGSARKDAGGYEAQMTISSVNIRR